MGARGRFPTGPASKRRGIFLRGAAIFGLTLSLLAGAVAAAPTGPLRFTHEIEFESVTLRIPGEIYLDAVGQTRVAVKVAGNLRDLQRRLPQLFSDVLEDSCERRIAYQLDTAIAKEDGIEATGRVQVMRFLCNSTQDRRVRLINQTIRIEARIGGGIVENCIQGRLERLQLDLSGLVGGVLNLTGLTERVSRRILADINGVLNDDKNCLDLPEALKAVDTVLTSGGFRDFGDGELGFVIKGRVEVTAQHMIDLIEVLARDGALRD